MNLQINHEFRTSLPSPMYDRSKNSIWSILKQCVDKELYRFTIPIVWNEPLSMLQRLAENLKYSNQLLDKCADMNNPIDRMKHVAAFLVSSTSIHNDRLSKPFNPLLGETFEFVSSDKNFRLCSEQVSHHPPISAFYSESTLPSSSSAKWKYYGSVYPHMKLNILNASVEAIPEGIQTVEMPEYDEVYTWQNLKINAHNLILGKLWFEYTGKAEIINHKLKIKCILEFKPYSWFSRQLNRCEGYILDSNDNKVALLYGKWDECLFCTNDVNNISDFNKKIEKILMSNNNNNNNNNTNTNTNDYSNIYTNFKNDKKYTNIDLLWKRDFSDKSLEQYFNFTKFTLKLNDLYDELKKSTVLSTNSDKTVSIGPLPITDSRYRPDMRLYESGEIDTASHEKNRLEEKQRETHKKIENCESPEWKPMWFHKKPHRICTQEETWTFDSSYWNRDFSKCPDIY